MLFIAFPQRPQHLYQECDLGQVLQYLVHIRCLINYGCDYLSVYVSGYSLGSSCICITVGRREGNAPILLLSCSSGWVPLTPVACSGVISNAHNGPEVVLGLGVDRFSSPCYCLGHYVCLNYSQMESPRRFK